MKNSKELKDSYKAPQLKVYGCVKSLTTSGTGGKGENWNDHASRKP